ncbi:MAG: class I SAM-dependent methyltransferase [Phycicoccus sp.]|nr:class I SAM-dependent methyltransferase [Phycicoccus sp.]NMM34806.1 class I SAM-dependent methyltransferase [Phycicoccus sp.]
MIPSPNIWNHPDVYEIENLGVDPEGLIEATMAGIHDWSGQRVLDLGCGSGFHLPCFARTAATVVGVEPREPLAALARRRISALSLTNASVLEGTAQRLPLADDSVDMIHARWAYFFGPGCEPGLAEVGRVLRPGGTAFVIDNDASRSTFGTWFRRARPAYDPLAIERFWARQGWSRESLDIRWSFGSRADFESVVRIEFTEALADEILAEHEGSGVDYAVNLFWRTG